MEPTGFQIFVLDHPSIPEEWRKSLEAPEAELPPLSSERAKLVSNFGVDPVAYRRGRLRGHLRQERVVPQAQRLGSAAQDVLHEIAPDLQLRAVVERLSPGEHDPELNWVFRLQRSGALGWFREEVLPAEIADAILGDRDRSNWEPQLKAWLASVVGDGHQ